MAQVTPPLVKQQITLTAVQVMYSSVGQLLRQLLLQLSLLFFLLSLVTADPESPGLLGEATKVSTILIVHLKENHLVLFKYNRQCFTLYSMCFDALKPVFCWDSLPRDSGSMSSERPFKIHEIGISTIYSTNPAKKDNTHITQNQHLQQPYL